MLDFFSVEPGIDSISGIKMVKRLSREKHLWSRGVDGPEKKHPEHLKFFVNLFINEEWSKRRILSYSGTCKRKTLTIRSRL